MEQQKASHSSNILNVKKTVIFNWPDIHPTPSCVDIQCGFDSSTPDSANRNLDLNTSNDMSPVTPSQTALERKFTQNKRDIGQWIGASEPPRSKTQNLMASSSFCNEAKDDDVVKFDSGIVCDSWQSLTSTSSHEDSILILYGQIADSIPLANESPRFIKPVPTLDLEEESISSPQVIKQSEMCSVNDCNNDVHSTSLTRRSIGESDCEVMDVLLGEEEPLKFINLSATRKTLTPPTTKRHKFAYSDVEPSDSSDTENISLVGGDDVDLFSDVTVDSYLASSEVKGPTKNAIKTNKNCDEMINNTETELKRQMDLEESRKDQDIFDFDDMAMSKIDTDDKLWSWNASSGCVNNENEKVYKPAKNSGLIGSREKNGSSARRRNQTNVHINSVNNKKESGRSLRVHNKAKTVESGKSLGVRNKKKIVESGRSLGVHNKEKIVESGRSLGVREKEKKRHSDCRAACGVKKQPTEKKTEDCETCE